MAYDPHWEDDGGYYERPAWEQYLIRFVIGLFVVFVILAILALLVNGLRNGGSSDAAPEPTATPAPTEVPQEFVTVPEGLDNGQLIDLLSQQAEYVRADVVAVVENAPVPAALGAITPPSTEGWLFPNTYVIGGQDRANPELFISQMLREFDRVAAETNLLARSAEIGVDPYDVLIIASLIEEEAFVAADRPKIARVIYNRLAAGWTLGIDATVVYALGGDRELSLADLEVDSPYNTRRFPGLPPTPISAPGQSSIEAALHPELGEWMYYVRTDEFGEGTHTFVVTEADFNAAVAICAQRDLGC